jgi:hypothetical protein
LKRVIYGFKRWDLFCLCIVICGIRRYYHTVCYHLLISSGLRARLLASLHYQPHLNLQPPLCVKFNFGSDIIFIKSYYNYNRSYKRRDKLVATALSKFIAHLVNHQVW